MKHVYEKHGNLILQKRKLLKPHIEMGLFKKRENQIRPSSKSNKSIDSSTGSMTRSQLNLAIMDMLNLTQSHHSCDSVCRGMSNGTPKGTKIPLNPLLMRYYYNKLI